MSTLLILGITLAIGTAGCCIVANVLRQSLDNTAEDNADGDWPNIPRIFTKQGD